MSISLPKNTNNEKFTSWVIFFGFEFFSSVKKHWTELLVNWTLNWTELEVQFSSVQFIRAELKPPVQFSSELKNPVQGQHCRRRSEFIRFPTEEKIRETKFRFSQIANFPGVVRLVDGTHIPIQVKKSEKNLN